MGKQAFRYSRLVAKSVGFFFAMAAVALFIIEYLPTYTEKGLWFWVFIGAGMVWVLDILWSTLDDGIKLLGEINKNRKH